MYAVSKTSFNEVKAKAVKRVSTRALHPSLATAHIFLNTNSNTRKREPTRYTARRNSPEHAAALSSSFRSAVELNHPRLDAMVRWGIAGGGASARRPCLAAASSARASASASSSALILSSCCSSRRGAGSPASAALGGRSGARLSGRSPRARSGASPAPPAPPRARSPPLPLRSPCLTRGTAAA